MPEETQPADEELVARTQAGDAEAFDDLVVRYSPRLYGLVYNMTSNHEDTNDLVQEIFAKAYRSLKRFQGKSAFYTWIYSIAVNMTLNFLKKRNRQRKLSLDDVDQNIQNDADFIEHTSKTDPVREVIILELQQRLNAALQTLSDDHRAVVTMFDIMGMPHNQISEILGVSPGTVRSQLLCERNWMHCCQRCSCASALADVNGNVHLVCDCPVDGSMAVSQAARAPISSNTHVP